SGTVYYKEVSNVACEVRGRVDTVNVEEGSRVKKGDLLVKLNSDILEKSLEAANASLSQAGNDLEKAKNDLKRIENLYKENSIAQQTYDDHTFNVKGLGNRVASLAADAGRLNIEVSKTRIVAPFSGIVISRQVDRGEWCSDGAVVALVAYDKVIDVVVDVPEEIIMHVKKGMKVNLRVAGNELKGKVAAIIPRGDISTRTFPVKIRAKNRLSLVEGMEGIARLPAGKKEESLLVHRDAIIRKFGKTIVFTVIDSKAKSIPVNITGYQGELVGLRAENLKAGMKVIIKGNERVREGQPVIVIGGS
ncbi:MAG: efflux RND transporter periplasmic adaptor subunit, partial [Proteobacteria bacterium]|nr:efflux RND transporter periplasmic adaptor subunit [Pseudomonadota bacterium]